MECSKRLNDKNEMPEIIMVLDPGIPYSSKTWVCFLYLHVFDLRSHPHTNSFLMTHENINFIKKQTEKSNYQNRDDLVKSTEQYFRISIFSNSVHSEKKTWKPFQVQNGTAWCLLLNLYIHNFTPVSTHTQCTHTY